MFNYHRINTCEHPKGHAFEPRYDNGDNTHAKTYVRDICVRCGATVERDEEKEQQ